MEKILLAAMWAFILIAVVAEVRRLRTERQPSPIEDTSYFDKIEEYRRDFE